jgi:hypothetical protein
MAMQAKTDSVPLYGCAARADVAEGNNAAGRVPRRSKRLGDSNHYPIWVSASAETSKRTPAANVPRPRSSARWSRNEKTATTAYTTRGPGILEPCDGRPEHRTGG